MYVYNSKEGGSLLHLSFVKVNLPWKSDLACSPPLPLPLLPLLQPTGHEEPKVHTVVTHIEHSNLPHPKENKALSFHHLYLSPS